MLLIAPGRARRIASQHARRRAPRPNLDILIDHSPSRISHSALTPIAPGLPSTLPGTASARPETHTSAALATPQRQTLSPGRPPRCRPSSRHRNDPPSNVVARNTLALRGSPSVNPSTFVWPSVRRHHNITTFAAKGGSPGSPCDARVTHAGNHGAVPCPRSPACPSPAAASTRHHLLCTPRLCQCCRLFHSRLLPSAACLTAATVRQGPMSCPLV
jgi:hypothetical protein